MMRKVVMILAFLFFTLSIAACTGATSIVISFDTDGGNEIENMTIDSTSTSVELPTPVKEGFTFDGWYTDPALTTSWSLAALLSGSGTLTLYAKWTSTTVTYTITFETNGGTAVSPIVLAAGATVTAPTAPTKTDFTFAGWYSDVGLTTAYTFGTMPAENITLYAKWNAVVLQQTISFEENGGTDVTNITQAIGSAVVAPSAPTKVGYAFGGWYTDSGLTTAYTFGVMPSTALTLYAKWTINNYTITFEENGGTAVTDILQAYLSAVTAPTAPTKEGYTFEGWYSDTGLTTAYTFATMPLNGITLYAKWTINNSTISFEENGGSAVADIVQEYLSVVTAPANPTKEGYTFAGWYSDTGLTTAYTFGTMPLNGVILYAKWTINNYTISFEENGGSAVTDIVQAYLSAVTAPTAPTKEGNTFGGWYSDTGLTTAYTFGTMPLNGITLYAKWTLNQYTISFEENGGSAVTDIVQAYLSAVTAPTAPTKEGYSFEGWYSDTGLTTAYTFATMPLNGITLYAKWTVNQYTITFEENGGSAVTDIVQAYLSAVTAPTAPTKEGYTFEGWYSDSGLTTAYTFGAMPLNGITLYAKWTAVNYTITFEENGGTEVTDIVQAYLSVVVAPTPPTKDGYAFEGWYSDSGLTTAYTFGTMPLNGITLYAKWSMLPHAISFVYGENTIPDLVLIPGTLIVLPADPIKVGYEFAGWYEDQLFLVPFIDTLMPDHDVILYAKWNTATYTLSFDTNDGTLIDDIELGQNQWIGMPPHPTRDGFIFAGWFTDEALLVAFTLEYMPAMDVMLYAKWITDEGYNTIAQILYEQPKETVKVRGVVYYVFPDPMNPGFYVSDGTGYIFVLAPRGTLAVGDGIEFNATFEFFEMTPQLVGVTNLVANSYYTTLPASEDMTFRYLAETYEDEIDIYGRHVIIRGIVGQMGPNFYIADIDSEEIIMINYKSYTPMDNPFASMVGQLVSFHAIVHDYNTMASQWHILYYQVSPVQQITLDDEDKVDELLAFGASMLDHMVFYPGQSFMIPDTLPVFGATLSGATFGDNASYYDVTTGFFATTDVMREIGFTITVTVGLVTKSADVTLILMPVEMLTIEEFLSVQDENYYEVTGVVLMIFNDIGLMIIADETGTLGVAYQGPIDDGGIITTLGSVVILDAQVGDLVVVGGYAMHQDGAILMGNDPTQSLREIISHDQPIPIAPFGVTVAQFSSLDVYNPYYWIKYYEISGTLMLDEMNHSFYLTDGTNNVPVHAMDKEMYFLLEMFTDFEVTLRGISLPNFDFDAMEPYLMLVFGGSEGDIELGYTDEELVALLGDMMSEWLGGMTFYPGEEVPLETTHPLFDVAVTYETFGENASLLDLITKLVSTEITVETFIGLRATITIGTAVEIVEIQIRVVPIEILTIAEFLLVAQDETMYFVQGVVIFEQMMEGVLLIADATGVVFVVTSRTDLMVGDMILVRGALMEQQGMIFLANDPSMTVVRLISSGNEMPMTPTAMTIEQFTLLDYTNPDYAFNYIMLQGTLLENEEYHIFFLSDGMNQIPVFTQSMEAYSLLSMYKGMEVNLAGLSLYNQSDEEPMMMLIFINYPGDVEFTMTDEELSLFLANALQAKFADEYFRPDYTVMLPTSYAFYEDIVTYELFGDYATLYSLETGYISDTITVETWIDVRATININGFINVVEFTIHVIPIQTVTIAEFLAGVENVPYRLEVVVILAMSTQMDGTHILADETGYLLCAKPFEFVAGDKVILIGSRTIHDGAILLWDVSHTVDSFNLISIEDPLNWGMYVELTGYVGEAQDIGYLLTDTLGASDFAGIVSMSSEALTILYDHLHLKVVIKGFLLPNFDGDETEPDRMLVFEAYDNPIHLVSTTDQEKIDELIALGTHFLEGQMWYPYDYVEIEEEMPALGATIVWAITSDNASVYDALLGRFNDVSEIEVVAFEATITVGSLTVVHTFNLTVNPYPVTTIFDFRMMDDFEVVKLHGVIIEEVANLGYILQDSSGMIMIKGYHDLQVGWEITIFGHKDSYNNICWLSGYSTPSQYNVINTGVSFTVPVTPMTLQDIGDITPYTEHPMVYTTIRGRLYYSSADEFYYLTDGVTDVYIYHANFGAQNTLQAFEGQDVEIKVYLNDYNSHFLGENWSVIFMGKPGDIQAIPFTDAEILEMMYDYVHFDLDHVYVENKIKMFSPAHPIYGGTIELALNGLNAEYAYIFENQFAITDIPGDLWIELEITITKGAETMTFVLSVEVLADDGLPVEPFIPGMMGSIPGEPPAAAFGTFGGLIIEEIERHNVFMGEGTEMIVNMSFPDASSLGADHVTLQYYDYSLSTWFDYMYAGVPLITSGDNFSLSFNGPMTLRLITSGVLTGNLTSNVVEVQYTNVDTYFAGWSLDESVYLTGIMFPYVGHGIFIEDVTVFDTDGVEVIGGISYQWYRLNPNTFETILIPGETNQLYITTIADLGYYLMVKVTGDEITVGGYMQIMSMNPVQLLNKGIVTDIDGAGFTLSMEYDVTMADMANLKIYNQDYLEIVGINIIPTADPAIYEIELDMLGATELHLELMTPTWMLGQKMFEYLMPGITVPLI